jgi:hypothetical protein
MVIFREVEKPYIVEKPVESRCKKRVYDQGCWDFHGHQCTRKVWKDGFCKQHHPNTEKMRRVEAERKLEKKWEKDPVNILRKALEKAQAQIKELEAENARLRNLIEVG